MTPNAQAYFRLVWGTIRSGQLIGFVYHRLRWIPGHLFLFWDGPNTHRSKQTRAVLRKHRDRLRVYRLPA